MVRLILILAVLLLIGGGVVWVFQQNYPSPPQETTLPTQTQSQTQTTTQPTLTQQQKSQAQKEITVSGTEFSFNPSSITLKAGEAVKLTFKNAGTISHNFVVEGTKIRTRTISPGSTSIEFTAPKTGKYTFYCSVPGHRERGMLGSLTVE